MRTSRRSFLKQVVPPAAGTGLIGTWAMAPAADRDAANTRPEFKLYPIGIVEKRDDTVHILIFDEYADGLLGLDGWSHVQVLYWFDKNDTPQQRRILQVHPRGNPNHPLTGVFACRAPVRPNLIGLSVCRILSIRDHRITVDELDAFDGTPVLDLKPFIPPDVPTQSVRMPEWARGGKSAGR
jgi:tRNA-Thr(GGU) m(6)t(6)A37 methyltransferase TsaA